MAANIPLNKLSNSKFQEFLEKYTVKNIPFESTLRKGYIDDVYNKTIENIKTEIGENKIWVSIDETCDVEGRFIANVVVGVLKTDSTGNIFLLHSESRNNWMELIIQQFANYLIRQWESYGLEVSITTMFCYF